MSAACLRWWCPARRSMQRVSTAGVLVPTAGSLLAEVDASGMPPVPEDECCCCHVHAYSGVLSTALMNP